VSVSIDTFLFKIIFMLYWVKTNRLIKWLFPNYIWEISSIDSVYLTFDDGPTPKVTNWVLDQLKKYNAKATFFCIGENIQKYPEIFKSLTSKGHSIGNHTFNHLNGWQTSNKVLMENIESCQSEIRKLQSANCNLFRPPYGKIKPSQSRNLQKSGYKIIMWDVLSADFDTSISKEKCLKNVLENIQPGSIVVFHDSKKAFINLEYVLPKVLDFCKTKNWKFEKI
jgi:peptidoglycan-N-acetylglucosamine deacetylase